ncbi:CBS domain containing-hemolysin-like protein [Frigoribacterium sp. PvP054]|uniref:hemolysin family protein n=1 Tax=Frigoribacterium sp. PvP054 TaxID=3156438 RepID=UPI00339287A2
MNEWVMVGIGLVLTVGTGFFVASEFSLVNLDRNELEARRDRGEKRLGPTIGALRITSTHLSGAQLGITLTTLLTGYTFEPAISSMLSGPLDAVGVPAGAVPVVGSVAGIVLATLFSMVVGELVPKNFALALPLATAKFVVPFQVAFTTVFKPLIVLFNDTANAAIRALGIEPKEELSGARSAEELSSLVRRSALEGQLDQDHATLLGRTLRFSQHDASEVMTPRVRMTTIASTGTAADVVEAALASGFSRFPVIGDDSDDIVGVVHVKHAFAVPLAERASVGSTSLMQEARFVPESMGTDSLLGLLRHGGLQMAVVRDEFGGTAGLVTLEDVVEELVGELEDEHDRARVGIVRQAGTVLFDGSLRPDELADRAGIRVPDDGDYETVAGFVIDRLDRLPEVGDEVALEGGSGSLRVERVANGRLERLRFVPAPDPADGLDAVAPTTEHDRVVASLREGITR